MTATELSSAVTISLCGFTAATPTARLAAITAAAERIKAKSFTINREAVVVGPDGLSRFEELSRRETARTAILHAFDLIEHDGEDLRNLPFLDRSGPCRICCTRPKRGILLNGHLAGDDPTVFAHPCQLGAKGIMSKKINARIDPARAGLDQGPQSRQHRGAAGTQRDLESNELQAARPAVSR
jgi:ATP-dependent DNA ligase